MKLEDLLPDKPIEDMSDEEFEEWRIRCNAECSDYDELAKLMGPEVSKQVGDRAEKTMNTCKVMQAFDAMQSVGKYGLNINEAVMAAATYCAASLAKAPKETREFAKDELTERFRQSLAHMLDSNNFTQRKKPTPGFEN